MTDASGGLGGSLLTILLVAASLAPLYILYRFVELKLWKRVLIGLAYGVVYGLSVAGFFGAAEGSPGEAFLADLKFVGDVFIKFIRLIIIPLIFFTLVAGVLALGDPKKLGTIGLKTIGLYLATTFFANVIGLAMGTIFRPGEGVDLGGAAPRELAAPAGGILDRIIAMATKNPFSGFFEFDWVTLLVSAVLVVGGVYFARGRADAAKNFGPFIALFAVGVAGASADVLFIIFCSILLGVGFLFMGEKGAFAQHFFDYASEVVLKVIHAIMAAAPYGVFALIAYVAGTKGVETFTAILSLTIAVYLGAAIHMALVYGGLIRFVLGLPFINFFRGILDAQMVAYSTSSSSATLPVTISNVTDNLGVKKSVAGSVLPLGATINMDGTALYLGIVALFTAQAFGYPIEFHHYFLIALTAALVSIGTAGIPSASLFLLATVLQVFDVTPEHTALVIGFIFPFDRLLDMMRTVVNVTGDAAVAVTVAKSEGELDEERFRGKAVQ
ncbi:MAG: dicarboxylate/amino acid:cation symporter [Pseudomonadota bacterium]